MNRRTAEVSEVRRREIDVGEEERRAEGEMGRMG